MKTFSATPDDIHHEWLIVDAQDVPLGRLASAQGQAKHDAATQSIVKGGDLDMEFLNQGGTLSLRGL